MNTKISFSLRKEKKDQEGLAPVLLRVTSNRKSKYVTTGVRVPVDQWDGNQMTGKTKTAIETNKRLEESKQDYYNKLREMKLTGKLITPETITENIRGRVESEKTLFRAIDLLEKDMKSRSLEFATIRKLSALRSHLSGFLTKKGYGNDVHITKVNYEFIVEFFQFLRDENLENNTALKYLSRLRTVMLHVLNMDWITASPFKSFFRKYQNEEKEQVSLNFDEFVTVYKTEMLSKHQELIKDLFLFQCCTGLSYSDMKNLTKDNITSSITGEKIINLDRDKSTASKKLHCEIPIITIAQRIIDKYKKDPRVINSGKLLYVPNNAELNETLKEIAILAGINKPLSTHAGRRTAATVLMEAGIDAATIVKILGHSSYAMLGKYSKMQTSKLIEDMNTFDNKILRAI